MTRNSQSRWEMLQSSSSSYGPVNPMLNRWQLMLGSHLMTATDAQSLDKLLCSEMRTKIALIWIFAAQRKCCACLGWCWTCQLYQYRCCYTPKPSHVLYRDPVLLLINLATLRFDSAHQELNRWCTGGDQGSGPIWINSNTETTPVL